MMRFVGAVLVPSLLAMVAMALMLVVLVVAYPAIDPGLLGLFVMVLAAALAGFVVVLVREWIEEREWRAVMLEEDRRHRAQMNADRALIAASRKGTARAFKEVAKTKEILGLMKGGV